MPPVGPMHDPVSDDFQETTALLHFSLAVFSHAVFVCGSDDLPKSTYLVHSLMPFLYPSFLP